VIPLVEFSFDRDDLLRRDAGRDDSRRNDRFDTRDRDEERRAYERDLERERQEDRRALDARAKAEFEASLLAMTSEDLRQMVNDPEIRVTSGGRISARRPSGLDTIRRSGQFSFANIAPPLPKKRKKNKKHCKNLSQCLRQANAEMRKKNGSLRKGKTQADVMRRAQRLLRKMK
jgi:hypothetical protein